MAYTYSKIATYTVGSGGVASIDFINIPQTYTDLVLVASIRSSRSNDEDGLLMTLNSNTSSYSYRMLSGNGSAASSETASTRFVGQITANTTTSSTFSNRQIYIPNYTSSNYKSISIDNVTEANATKAYAQMLASLWSNTAPITSISLLSDSYGSLGSLIAQHSTAHLYGVKAEL
jgi:hypothetical protein